MKRCHSNPSFSRSVRPRTQTFNFNNSTQPPRHKPRHTHPASAPDVLLALSLRFLLGADLIEINCPRDLRANTAAQEHQPPPHGSGWVNWCRFWEQSCGSVALCHSCGLRRRRVLVAIWTKATSSALKHKGLVCLFLTKRWGILCTGKIWPAVQQGISETLVSGVCRR